MVKTWEGLLSWQPLLTASATLTFRSPLLGAEATIKKKKSPYGHPHHSVKTPD